MQAIARAGMARWVVLVLAAAGVLLLYAGSVPTTTTAHPAVVEAGNVAPLGVAYRWSHNVSDTSNARRAAARRLNDSDLTVDVPLNGSRYEPVAA
ncbi:MAG TPA: hypothetical protein VK506_16110, partial [Conexibacter sp.]|nr:hypothetical protein [Conexibacter sp.]